MTDNERLLDDAATALDIVVQGGATLLLRARPGPVRDWAIARLAANARILKLTPDIDPEALDARLDVTASLAAGRRVETAGLLAGAVERIVVLTGAERVGARLAARLAQARDAGDLPRLVAIDEGEDEPVPRALTERLAMRIDLAPLSIRDLRRTPQHNDDLKAAAPVNSDPVTILVESSLALGIADIRAPMHTIDAARRHARLARRSDVTEADLAFAMRCVLAQRAQTLPSEADAEPPPPPDDLEAEPDDDADGLRERMIEAARIALPDGLLAARNQRGTARNAGSAEARRGSGARGKLGHVRRELPGRGGRLDLAATLLAAAPMQRMRNAVPGRPQVRRDDIRVRRRVPKQRALTVFAVDASGSAALSRLAEVKGAVEQLLSESYVRRDEVALVAFRGEGAELLLPPTRALARAKRALAGLPGGGATPLAHGVIAGLEAALRGRAAGRAPLLVVLTDGGANIARDGRADRATAQTDALAAARLVAGNAIDALVVDGSPRGDAKVRALAEAMAARYIALPRLDAGSLAGITR